MSLPITRPEPLPTDRYVTVSERQAHAAQLAAYEASLREAEKPPVKAEPDKPSIHTLTDQQYDDLRRKEWEANQQRQRERDEAAQAAAKEKADYLASSPEVAEIRAYDPYSLMLEVTHWASRGYTVFDGGALWFTQSFYHVQLQAPAPATASRKQR